MPIVFTSARFHSNSQAFLPRRLAAHVRGWVSGWRVLLIALVCLGLAACGGESAPQSREQRLLSYTAHQLIAPWYADLNVQAGKLFQQSQIFCQGFGQAVSELQPTQQLQTQQQQAQRQIQQQWRVTMMAWARVQPVAFGPLEDGNWRWKLQFWPDRKDLARNKIEALISADDPLSAQRVAAASVSVQGLAALEYLLFDERGSRLARYREGGERRCLLLQAITTRVQQVTQQLADEWQGNSNGNGKRPTYAEQLAQPGSENALFPDNKAAIAVLLNTLVMGSEVVKRNKLGIPIGNGKGASHVKPYRLEAWRSQYSLALMRTSVTSLEQLYRGGQADGYSLADYLAENKDVEAALLAAIDEGFVRVNKQFAKLNAPLFSQLKEPQQYTELVELHRRLNALQVNLNLLPQSLGISLGFNSNDGD